MPGSIPRHTRVPATIALLLLGGVTLLGQRGARTSVSRGGGGGSRSAGSASVNRSAGSASVNRSAGSANRNVNANDFNANRNVNVNNVNVNRNVNVDRDIDVDRRYGGWGDACCYNGGVARAAAVTAAAVTTAAVVGSVVHSLPPSCSAVDIDGITYQQCGSTWYQPQFAGTTVNYTVVNPPR
jgi:hypothetical protein